MRRRSPSYSPPRRGYVGRGRSPPRGRYGGRRDAPCGLLVRNIPKDSRPEEVRIPFERFGRIRDVYLPNDYYTGEPRGFGFVQYLDPLDAAEAKRHMDHQIFNGREITVVFAEENRKKPDEMRTKGRSRGRMSYGGRWRSPHRGYSPSRSPRYRSPSPRSGRYTRSTNVASRRERYESRSPSPAKGRVHSSISPDTHKKGRGHSPADRSYSPPLKAGQADLEAHRKGRGDSYIEERSPSPELKERQANLSGKRKIESQSRSFSPAPKRYSRSPRSVSRSRSRSPRPPALPTRRRFSPTRRSNLRDSPEAQKTYSSLTPEERSLHEESLSPGRSQ